MLENPVLKIAGGHYSAIFFNMTSLFQNDKRPSWLHSSIFKIELTEQEVRGSIPGLAASISEISCFQVAIWLKYRTSDVNPQYNQPTSNKNPKGKLKWIIMAKKNNLTYHQSVISFFPNKIKMILWHTHQLQVKDAMALNESHYNTSNNKHH